jgi:flagellar motor switch protein FliN
MMPPSQFESQSPQEPVRAAFAATDFAPGGGGLGLLLDMELPLMVRFGRTRMQLSELARLNVGSVIELDSPSEDAVELVVNGAVVARGMAVTVEGNYGIRISELVLPSRLDVGRGPAPAGSRENQENG